MSHVKRLFGPLGELRRGCRTPEEVCRVGGWRARPTVPTTLLHVRSPLGRRSITSCCPLRDVRGRGSGGGGRCGSVGQEGAGGAGAWVRRRREVRERWSGGR